jgi:hypothetical protein
MLAASLPGRRPPGLGRQWYEAQDKASGRVVVSPSCVPQCPGRTAISTRPRTDASASPIRSPHLSAKEPGALPPAAALGRLVQRKAGRGPARLRYVYAGFSLPGRRTEKAPRGGYSSPPEGTQGDPNALRASASLIKRFEQKEKAPFPGSLRLVEVGKGLRDYLMPDGFSRLGG